MSRGTKDLIRGAAAAPAKSGNGSLLEPRPPQNANSGGAAGSLDGGNASSSQVRRRPSDPPPLTADHDLVQQLKSKVELQRRELDDRTDNVNAIQRNFQRLSEMYAGDRQKIESLEKELEACRAELESLRAERKVHAALRAEFAAMQAECEKLRQASVAGTARQTADLEQAKKQNSQLQSELALLRRTVENAAQVASRGDDEKASLDRAVSELSAGLKIFVSDLGAVADNVNPPNEGIAASSTVKGEEGSRDGDFAARVSRSMAVLRDDGEGRLALQRVMRGIEAMRQRHATALSDADGARQTELAALTAAKSQLALELAEAKKQLAEFQSQLKDLTKMFALERQSLSAKVVDAQNGGAERLAQLQRERDDAVAISKDFEEQLQRRNAEVAALTTERETLTAEIANLRAALQNALKSADEAAKGASSEAAALRQRLDAAESALGAARAEAASLRSTISKRDDAMADLERKLSALREASTVDRDRAARSLAADAEAQRLAHAAALAALEQRLATLQAERQADAARHAAEQQASKAHIVGLERDLERAQHEAAVANERVLELELELERSKAELLECRNELQTLQRSAGRSGSEAEQRAAAAERAVRAAEAERDALRVELDALQQTVKALRDEAKRAKDAEQRATALHATLAAEHAGSQKEISQLRSALLGANEAKATADAKHESAQRRCSAAEQEAREAKSRAEALVAQHDDTRRRAAELEERISRVQAWQNELKGLQHESIKVVKKVLVAEEACESAYSCSACLEVMRDPVVCAPCGHAYCRACLMKSNKASGGQKGVSYCPECDDDGVTHIVPSKNLELLTSRFDFRKRSLGELAATLDRTFASLNNHASADSLNSTGP